MTTPTDKSPRSPLVGREVVDNWDIKHFGRTPVAMNALQHRVREDLIAMIDSAYLAVKEELDKSKSALRCGQCGNVGMFHHGLVMQDNIDKLQQELEAARAEVENLSIKLQRTVNAAHSALLETTAWMGIPEKKRDNQINQAMENVKYCAEHDLRHQDISNIKNEYQKQLADAQAEVERVTLLKNNWADLYNLIKERSQELEAQIKDYEDVLRCYIAGSTNENEPALKVLEKWSGK